MLMDSGVASILLILIKTPLTREISKISVIRDTRIKMGVEETRMEVLE